MAEIEIKGWEGVMGRIKSLPEALKTEVMQAVGEYAIKIVSVYPPRVDHDPNADNPVPYIWNSDRQRRAFFATNGFGRGIPTKRTDELKKGWEFGMTPGGGYLKNATPYASFVVGDNEDMQRGHIADGWKRIGSFMAKLSFRSSAFRDVVRAAVKRAIGKLNLG